MRNLNEGIEDLLNGTIVSNIPDIDTVLSTTKKKKRTSIFGDDEEVIPKISVIEQSPIVIPQPIAEEFQENVVSQISQIDRVQEIKRISALRSKKKNKTEQISQVSAESLEKRMQEVRKEIEALRGEDLPENINIIEIEEEVSTALEDIPGAEHIDIGDLDIRAIPTKKDKTGYFKSEITSRKENYPDILLKIASYVKKRSKGLLIPRKVDLRVLANTNKTQLRGSALKLGLTSIVFKPDPNKLKVNKGTRFMISVPEDYMSSKNIIVYIQESRNKKIIQLSPNDTQKTQDNFNAFIGDRVVEYYFSGFDITVKKLELRSVNNPLMDVTTNIIATHEFKAIPHVDENSHVYSVDFYSKGVDNQWLYIQVVETEIPGKYELIAKNKVDQTWNFALTQKPVTLNALNSNLYNILSSCFGRVWDKELNIEDNMRFYYLYDKLSHAKLKNVMVYMFEMMESEENSEEDLDFQDKKIKINPIIKETLSKKDTAKALKIDYDSEAIIFKTDFIDYCICSFLAYPIVGGDKRKGSDYITTEQYYEKYNVKDTRNYQERQKTISKKEGTERNYNSRIYLYQLEYSVKGKVHIYRNTKWEDVLKETGIFTTLVKFPETKF